MSDNLSTDFAQTEQGQDFWPSLPENLKRRIKKTDSCWIWVGCTSATRKGYGTLHTSNGKLLKAHRLVYEIAFGVILTQNQLVCHRCDNPPCVNPSHLFLGTHVDNRKDCVAKGRQAKGENNGRAILTEAQVSEIRRLYGPYKMSVHKLGRMFGVSGQTIHRALRGESWNHENR
jgi:hypothetical protein